MDESSLSKVRDLQLEVTRANGSELQVLVLACRYSPYSLPLFAAIVCLLSPVQVEVLALQAPSIQALDVQYVLLVPCASLSRFTSTTAGCVGNDLVGLPSCSPLMSFSLSPLFSLAKCRQV